MVRKPGRVGIRDLLERGPPARPRAVRSAAPSRVHYQLSTINYQLAYGCAGSKAGSLNRLSAFQSIQPVAPKS